MQISFFEEFPTKENIKKIQFVSFPTKVYFAAHSLKEFESISIPSKKVKEKIYWPILKKEEGYWVSPFSKKEALERVFEELKNSPIPVMIDAELPTPPNPFLYITEAVHFFQNRKRIRRFIEKRKGLFTAEYFPSSGIGEKMLYTLGISFKTKNHYTIKMLYSSMHTHSEQCIRRKIQQAQKGYGKRLCIGLGTLTHGIMGNEPVISLELLERDLRICKELGIEEVIIFRLGGLNKEYGAILQKWT